VLEDGTRAHWIGEEGAEVIVNFHGSSYPLTFSENIYIGKVLGKVFGLMEGIYRRRIRRPRLPRNVRVSIPTY